jgi:DNA-binding CsgD family transcriptional regulator
MTFNDFVIHYEPHLFGFASHAFSINRFEKLARQVAPQRAHARGVSVTRNAARRRTDSPEAWRVLAGSIVEVRDKMRRSQLKSSIGVLLLDAQLRLVHHTAEAAAILEYPRKPRERVPLAKVLPAIRSQLASPPKAVSAASLEFTSGRRRYWCRAFLLDPGGRSSIGGGDRLQPKIVVILERVFPQAPDIMRSCEAFQLTSRESETVTLLLKGLSSKQIADQMSISPSTVKSFLKLVMNKVGASSRMGIIAKILGKAS